MSRETSAEARLARLRARVEDGLRERGRHGEAPGAALEQAAERGACRADARGQADARKEGRARRADVRVGRDQQALGLLHVGPAHQHLRGDARGDIGQFQALRRDLDFVLRRDRLAHQQRERIDVGGALPLELREAGPRGLVQRLREAKVDLGRDARTGRSAGASGPATACGSPASPRSAPAVPRRRPAQTTRWSPTFADRRLIWRRVAPAPRQWRGRPAARPRSGLPGGRRNPVPRR